MGSTAQTDPSKSFEKPIKKGYYQIGGNASASYINSSSKQPYTNYNSTFSSLNLAITPTVGKFLANGFLLSISPVFSVSKGKTKYNSIANTTVGANYGLGVNAKYYFPTGLFAKIGSSIGYTKQTFNGEVSKSSSEGSYINLTPGIGYAYFFNNHIALETSLNYSIYQYSESIYSRDINSLGLSLSLSIFLDKK